MNYTTLQRLVLMGLSLIAFTHVASAMRRAADDTWYDRATAFYENLAEGQDPINIDFRKTITALKKDNFAPADMSYVVGKVRGNPSFITAEDTSGNSLLAIAAQKGRLDVAQFLIDQGARVNWPNKNGETPLSLATQPAMAHLLFENGGIDTKRYDRTQTIAENLAEGQDPINIDFRKTIGALKKDTFAPTDMSYVVGKVTSNPRFVRAEDTSGNSLLAIAAQKGRVDVARFLIQQGARINWPNKQGETPLDSATKAGQEDMIQLLRAQGGVIGIPSPRVVAPLSPMTSATLPAQKTPIKADSVWYDRNDLSKVVANLGDNADFKATIGFVENGRQDLLSHNIQDFPNFITAEDSGGNSLLTHAAIHGQVDIARFLIEHGARVNWPNKQGETPLAFAIKAGNNAMIELLQTHGGLFNAKVTIMLLPTEAYRNGMANFAQRYITTTPLELNKLKDVKTADKLHVSLAYILIPLSYSDDEATKEEAARLMTKISNISQESLELFLADPNFLKSVTWDDIRPMGKFIAVSFKDTAFKPLVEMLYDAVPSAIKKATHKLYPKEEPLHVSIAQVNDEKDLEGVKLPQRTERTRKELTLLGLHSPIEQRVSILYPVRGKTQSDKNDKSIPFREQ